jgi:hypothetical protein
LPRDLEHLQLNDDEYVHPNTPSIGHTWEDTINDAELIKIVSNYLASIKLVTLRLKSLTLLLHDDQRFDDRGRNKRNVENIRSALEPHCHGGKIQLLILKENLRPGRWGVGELRNYDPHILEL